MASLCAKLEDALLCHGRLVLLAGQPGIGKTRTAEEIASVGRRRGARVLVGRCFEGEGAPPYWPWVQVFRSYLREAGRATVDADLGSSAAEIAQILPEIRERMPNLPAPPALEGEEARFRSFDAMTRFFLNAALARPLVVVLDDLHWADKPSLLLLHFVAREIAAARILIVGTCRDVDVEPGNALEEVLPRLRRERVYERLSLRGLPEDDVRGLLMSLGGDEIPDALVRSVSQRTEGNPFFVQETLRHLLERGFLYRRGKRWKSQVAAEEVGLPQGVREMIARRLRRFPLTRPRKSALLRRIGNGLSLLVNPLARNRESTTTLAVPILLSGPLTQLFSSHQG